MAAPPWASGQCVSMVPTLLYLMASPQTHLCFCTYTWRTQGPVSALPGWVPLTGSHSEACRGLSFGAVISSGQLCAQDLWGVCPASWCMHDL